MKAAPDLRAERQEARALANLRQNGTKERRGANLNTGNREFCSGGCSRLVGTTHLSSRMANSYLGKGRLNQAPWQRVPEYTPLHDSVCRKYVNLQLGGAAQTLLGNNDPKLPRVPG
jgi:hypothetical protein